jgi:flagellar biosynthesis protein FlhF
MNIQRFTAPNSREALAKARLAFGDETLILSNRSTASGVEVLATAENTLAPSDRSESFAIRVRDQAPALSKDAELETLDLRAQVEDDAAQLAMSTLSFQDYVRERMLRRRAEALAAEKNGNSSGGGNAKPSAEPRTPAPAARTAAAPAKTGRAEVPAAIKTAPARKPEAPALAPRALFNLSCARPTPTRIMSWYSLAAVTNSFSLCARLMRVFAAVAFSPSLSVIEPPPLSASKASKNAPLVTSRKRS